MRSVTQNVARWALVVPLCLTSAVFSGATFRIGVAFASEPDTAEKATLRISLKWGAVKEAWLMQSSKRVSRCPVLISFFIQLTQTGGTSILNWP